MGGRLVVFTRSALGWAVLALLLLLVAGGAVALLAGPFTLSPSPAAPFLWPSPPLVLSASGASEAPPFTLPAYRLALRAGAQALVAPVRFSSEGEPLVCAADDVAAVTEGRGLVAHLSLQELRVLDAGYRFADTGGGHPYRGHGLQLPLLEEVLAAFPGVPLLVEVVAPAPSPAAVARLAGVIRRWEVSGTILLGATRPEMAAALRREIPQVPALSTPQETAAFLRLARVGLSAWTRPSFRVLRVVPGADGKVRLTTAQVEAAHAQGLAVLAGPTADQSESSRLAGLGVDALVMATPLSLPRQ